MTDERIREALEAEAAGAPDADDLWDRTTRRIRRRRVQRWASVATMVILAAAVIGTLTVPTLDEPQEAVLGDADVPADWQDVSVSEAVVSVPPDWQVVDVTGAAPDAPAGEEPELDEDPPVAEAESRPCPPFDPDRPALVYSEEDPPLACPGSPEFTGLAVAGMRSPSFGLSPTRIENGEPARAGTVPVRAVAGALVTGDAAAAAVEGGGAPAVEGGGASMAEGGGDVTTFVVPGLAAAVEVRPGSYAEEVGAALDTLRPYDDFDAYGAVHAFGLTDEEGSDREFVGWAVDADGRFHRWFSERVGDEPVGAAFWPAVTGRRFGAVVETGGDVRVVTARPGDDVFTEFPLEAGVSLDSVAWSPGGEAVAWLAPGALSRLALFEWVDADALADEARPERTDVAVTGLPEQDRPVLDWDTDDRGEHLLVRDVDSGHFRADIRRDDAGRLDLPDPLTFSPRIDSRQEDQASKSTSAPTAKNLRRRRR